MLTPPDPQALRRALGRFTTGVTIVTCVAPDGSRVGLTANSFQSLSLQPPLVLWSLRLASGQLETFRAVPRFAVNVLSEGQVDVSRRFAAKASADAPAPDRFADAPWAIGEHGAPVLAGCVAVFECETVSQRDEGDHVLFIGRVLTASESNLPPLVFQGGHYRLLGEVL
jgi:4-hydroxyphenylacetate 3-hydroxylase, reductase component